VSDSEITSTILRQIRDEIVALRTDHLSMRHELKELTGEVATTRTELKGELGSVQDVIRDLAAQMLMIGRYIKNKQDVAIADLRKRVARLEKKVG
jgi:NTP pyrophosphatase (non-canonical NTP hydrolase)